MKSRLARACLGGAQSRSSKEVGLWEVPRAYWAVRGRGRTLLGGFC